VRILVMGGTQFVGRALVEEAARRSHEVTIFHRGTTEPDDLPEVEHVHGDRHGDLAQLGRTPWDAVIDTHAYVPAEVRAAVDALDRAAGHYTLVSTIAVHTDDGRGAANEESPRHPALLESRQITSETYGPLKVACELEAAEAFGDRCLTIRPGYLIGPHDPTDRFTAWVRRAAAGGEMLAPGPPDAPFQVLDVRDLATFTLDRVEAANSGVYSVVGEPSTMGDVLETACRVAGAGTSLRWVDEDLLDSLGDDRTRWLPLWHPRQPLAHTYDAAKAARAGLRRRALAESVADILAWDVARGAPELRCGLPPEKERELLAASRDRRAG
jgi:2'-hydroxyisoflavone reductase